MVSDDTKPLLPLSPAIVHILLALAGEDRHGYGIMQEIARQSEGQYRVGPGTLYDNLQKLMDLNMVDEIPLRSATSEPRRKLYHLTAFGIRVLTAETTRLQGVVRDAKLHLRALKPRSVS